MPWPTGAWRWSANWSLETFLAQSELLSPSAASASQAVRHRLATDKLVVAFVAEFSRGKSELINAIFFADAGRRILPATPGRTTMCPVELSWDPAELPTLDLLPIETRRQDKTLAEWSVQRDRWYRIPLDPSDPDGLAMSLQQVTQTRSVSREDAQRLGLWSEEHPQDNPPTLPTVRSRSRPGAMRSSTTPTRCCSAGWWSSTPRA
jgi:hypothetical protein